MNEDTVDMKLSRRWANAKSERGKRDKELRDQARYIRPEHAEFFTEGQNHDQRPMITQLWDDTAIKACGMWARGVNSMTHNPATDWFGYKDENDEVNRDRGASQFYANVNKDLRREARESGLYAALLQRLHDVGAYGYGALYSYETDNTGRLAFEYVPAPECYFTLNRKGLCNTFTRPLNLNVYEAEERGIDLNKCTSEQIKQAKRQGDQTTRFLFVHHVCKTGELGEDQTLNHEWTGFYFEVQGQQVVQRHGFHDMPYHVLPWTPVPQSPYSIGIGYTTLPEIRNLNGQRKQFSRILDNESDSPLLAPANSEGAEQNRPQSGESLYGGMSGDGKRLWDPLYKGAMGSRILKEEVADSRALINEAYHTHLMLMIARGDMTATEVASRDEKIIQAMGPFIIPMFADLKTIVDRMFHSRMRAGAYDPLPAVFDEDTEMALEFHGILAKAHKKLTAGNIVMFYSEAMGTIGEVAPEKVQGLNHDAALEHLADARAIPAGIVPTESEREAKEEAARQHQAQQMMLENARNLGGAVKDTATAQQMMEQGADGGNITLAP